LKNLEPGTDCKHLELIANGAINRPGSRNRLHSTKWKGWQTKTKIILGITKKEKKLCFCLTIPPPKNIQNFAMNHITKVQLEPPVARETITVFFIRLDSTVNLYKINKIIQNHLLLGE